MTGAEQRALIVRASEAARPNFLDLFSKIAGSVVNAPQQIDHAALIIVGDMLAAIIEAGRPVNAIGLFPPNSPWNAWMLDNLLGALEGSEQAIDHTTRTFGRPTNG